MSERSSSPERVLHVAHLTSAHEVDDSRIFHKECRSLADAGFKVSLVAVHPEDAVLHNVQVVALPETSSRPSRMMLTPLRLLRRAWRLKADIYHFHDPELLPIGLILRALGARVIYDVHEDVPLDIMQKTYLPRVVKRPLSLLARVANKVADRALTAIVTVTPDVASTFRDAVLVRNYPILGEIEPSDGPPYGERDELAVYIGSITGQRGSQIMAETVRLAGWNGDRKLLLAGALRDEDLEGSLAANDHPAMEYLGILDRPGVSKLLGRVRVGVYFAQPENPGYLTAYPIKLFEYMAAGIPVVMSNFPVYAEIIDGAGCGLTVDPTDPQACADAIEWLLDHPAEAEAMGKRGRAAIEDRYNFAGEAVRLRQLYRDIVER